MARNWDGIRTAYVTSEVSLRSLAKTFGVSMSQLGRRSREEKWTALRKKFMSETSALVLTQIQESQVKDQMILYDVARAAIENMIQVIHKVADDPDGFFRYAIQREQSVGDSRDKWVEDKVLMTVNGKNLADVAKALTSITPLARILDRIVEAPIQAKLDLEREKLELDKRRAGMNDDIESESGIVELPAVDDSILDTAIPDPEQSDT